LKGLYIAPTAPDTENRVYDAGARTMKKETKERKPEKKETGYSKSMLAYIQEGLMHNQVP
jgi:hypothetical protein